MEKLFSPWRLRYIASVRRTDKGCVFCHASRSRMDRANLVLHRGRTHFVILNKYPYNNAHLMIVPYEHRSSLRSGATGSLEEMMSLVIRCEEALRAVYRPSGINLGMNLGRSAGAGIAGHYHMHLVPRWDGDTNFMTVVHGTRVIPEALSVTYRRLRPLLKGGGRIGGTERARGTLRRARQGRGR
jgi:ATP adenylyltransferase